MQPEPPPGFNPYAPPASDPLSPNASPGGIVSPPGSLRIEGAFSRAFDLMKRFLFSPFSLGKWFVFGFIVWLAELGEGGGLPTGFTGLPGGGSPMPDLRDALEWIQRNRSTLLALGVVSAIALLALTLLFVWLSARGLMMSLRAVALNHARFGEHWNATREAAWSYFGFRLLLGAIGLPFLVCGLAWAAYALYAVVGSGTSDVMDYVRALVLPIVGLVAFALLVAPFHFLGRNVLAPMLLRFGGGLRPNWSRTMTVVRTGFGGVVAFLVVRFVIGLVQGMAEVIAIYATCCVGLLPVLHQTLVAPFHAFERAFTLCVFESLGPDYKIIVDAPSWQPPYPQYPYPQQYPPYPPR